MRKRGSRRGNKIEKKGGLWLNYIEIPFECPFTMV